MKSLKTFLLESLENPSFTVVRNADEKPVEEKDSNQEKIVGENLEVDDENVNQETEK